MDHLKKNLLTIHPTAKYFHDMWKRACDKAAEGIAEAKVYNIQRYDKTHMEPHCEERENAVEVRLTGEFSRKNPVFPVSLVKPYSQTGDNKFSSRSKSYTPQDIVEVEDSPGPVKMIIKARKTRDNIW
ncbi:hypothetical protein O181_016267 [Austropuccinia psidii MF-1]|uniref:Uncharacterized protein n=1 Tax=Austropuccinia psidii MF-1 TaxID=1389203 RepID=A0A9Q3C598_9BASI|nr:hypothetical protein [Austropuccinia psidii MF-1]